jgi:hypothetical protein
LAIIAEIFSVTGQKLRYKGLHRLLIRKYGRILGSNDFLIKIVREYGYAASTRLQLQTFGEFSTSLQLVFHVETMSCSV